MPFQFADPRYLLLLIPVLLLILAVWLRDRRRVASLPFPSVRLPAQLRRSRVQSLQWVPRVLRILAFVLLTISLARPQVGRTSEIVPAEGLDIVLALDASWSMREKDLSAERRFDVVRRVLKDFVAGRKSDRQGLVVFAGESMTLSPLTLDTQALLTLLDRTDAGMLGERASGTAIGTALAHSLNVLRESTAKNRIVILLTDGENNTGEINPDTAAQMGKLLGMRVYTIGIGGSTAVRSVPGRTAEPPALRAGGGDERTLRKISDTTGGMYFSATSEETLKQVYQQIATLETSEVGGRRYTIFDEVAPYAVTLAVFLLFLEIGLRSTLLRRFP